MKTKLITTNPDYLLLVNEYSGNPKTPFVRMMANGKIGLLSVGNEHGGCEVIAHLSLNGSPILEGVTLLPELPDPLYIPMILAKENAIMNNYDIHNDTYLHGFIEGYKAASQKKNSEEEVIRIGVNSINFFKNKGMSEHSITTGIVRQIIDELSLTSILPIDFIPEYLLDYSISQHLEFSPEVYKTIPNEQGIPVIQGKYIH